MSDYLDSPTRTFEVSSTSLSQYCRVKFSGNYLVAAGATDPELGVVIEPTFSADGIKRVAVRLRTAQGTSKFIAAAAISKDAAVYAAASGKVSSTAAGVLIGRALHATTADGDIVEVLRSDSTQGAALTAQLTTITHTAPSTPDYAVQNLTNSSPYGFATADEGNTVLSVVANLQARLAEVEARLEAKGIVVPN